MMLICLPPFSWYWAMTCLHAPQGVAGVSQMIPFWLATIAMDVTEFSG